VVGGCFAMFVSGEGWRVCCEETGRYCEYKGHTRG